MSDVIPPPPPRRDSGGCWKWGAISCIGLGCVGAIVIAVLVYAVMRTPMFKQAMRSGVEAQMVAKQKLPEVGRALAKYRDEKGDYPKKLDDLAPKYITPENLTWSGGSFTYHKPPKDALESFVVVSVTIPTAAGAPPMVVQMQKDGTISEPTMQGYQPGALPAPPSGGK